MRAPRAARSAPAPDPCRLSGFDATNLAGAIEQLEGAQGSPDAIRPRDPQLAKQFDRLRGRLVDLTGELRQLRGAQ